MVLTAGGNAPYAPPATVIDVLTRYRERGMTTPFTSEVLERAGVPESLSRRTMHSLKLLGLIDAQGNPVPAFEQANRAPDDEYREKMRDLILDTYSEVLTFADPATDSYERVRDAFRGFDPRGQQERMVTLFLGLLDFLGIDTSKAGSRAENAKRATNGQGTPKKPPAKKPPSSSKGSGDVVRKGQRHEVQEPDVDGLPPGLLGLLRQIPRGEAGWSKARRDEFLTAFTAVLNFTIPVRESEPVTVPAEHEEDAP